MCVKNFTLSKEIISHNLFEHWNKSSYKVINRSCNSESLENLICMTYKAHGKCQDMIKHFPVFLLQKKI